LLAFLTHNTSIPSPNTMAPSWLKKNSLKNRDDQRTKASELTLRQSIYPIVLVTILFFLWVSKRLDFHRNSIAHELEFSLHAIHLMPKMVSY
jgi:hypothetical protein